MKNQTDYQLSPTILALAALAAISVSTPAKDPLLDSWFTQHSGKYARLYATTSDLSSGNAKTTWSRGAVNQSLPAYSGVQEIYSSADWIYIRTSGLGSHVMGPWYLNAAKTQLFPNLPRNKKALYRIPRRPVVATTKTLTGLGVIGYFVDGVAMFDGQDGFSWNGSSESGGMGGGGIWNRDAYVNEGITFDPANAHQEQSGTYHYHANPIALRHLLGDHVDYDVATKVYRENPSNLHHSPILGWVRDGFPIYGPYGYSDPKNPGSGVRRMISGFVLRNGANGTLNLAANGRTTLPAWAARAQNRSTALTASQYGPAVSTQYSLGRYLQDNDYLGDLGKVQGVDFDLDEYNGRFTVTPEFPNGSYAYFVSINANGTPVFPYNIGRSFCGTPTGSAVQNISETVTTNFVGGANSTLRMATPAAASYSSDVTITWSAVEGGAYVVRASSDLANWTQIAGPITASGASAQASIARNQSEIRFFHVNRTALANYDGAPANANVAQNASASSDSSTTTR